MALGRKRRVRPRFFLFATVVAGLAVWALWPLPHPPASPSPKAIATHPTLGVLQTTSRGRTIFVLPEPISGFSQGTQGAVLEIAGGTSRQGPSALSAAITSQGLVQGPSGPFLPGGMIVFDQGQWIFAGGMNHNQAVNASVSLSSGQAAPPILPEPLAYAGVAVLPATGATFLVGGMTPQGASDTIWLLQDGSFRSWAHLPKPVAGAASAAGGQLLVVAGGTVNSGQANPSIWIFQARTHRLLDTLTLPFGIEGASLLYWHGVFWLLGGQSGTRLLNTIWQIRGHSLYRASSTLPEPLSDFGAAVMGHSVWLVGGEGVHGPTGRVQELTLADARQSLPK